VAVPSTTTTRVYAFEGGRFHDVPEMLPTKQLKNNDIVGSAEVRNCRARLWLCSPGKDAKCDRVIVGETKEGIR